MEVLFIRLVYLIMKKAKRNKMSVKTIQTEKNFGEAVYRSFKEKKYGIASCCYIDLEKLKVKKQICDWQDISPCESSCSGGVPNIVNVGLVGTSVVNTSCTDETCPQVTVCPDNKVLINILNQLNVIQDEIQNIKPDSFVFTQPTPSALWTIVHNLDKYPNVAIEDLSGDDIMAQISYVNLNTITITFIIPMAGTAYLS